MKNLLLLTLIMVSYNSMFSQKIKYLDIYSTPNVKLEAAINYEGNIPKDTIISFMAKDSRYNYITEFIIIYSGSMKDIYSYFTKIEKFVSENEPDCSTDIDGYSIHYTKVIGINDLFLFEKKGNGYLEIMPKKLTKLKNKFIEWCSENNISI